MGIISVIVLSIIGMLCGIVLADAIIRFTFQHQITDAGLEIALFGKLTIRRIPFSNIEEVRQASFRETVSVRTLFTALRFGLLRIRRGIVLVRLREAIRIFPFLDVYGRKVLLLFPDDPDGFIRGFYKKAG